MRCAPALFSQQPHEMRSELGELGDGMFRLHFKGSLGRGAPQGLAPDGVPKRQDFCVVGWHLKDETAFCLDDGVPPMCLYCLIAR